MNSVHKYHKSCFEFIWPFYGFLELYEIKLRRSHNFMSSVQKYHKSCFKLNWPFSVFLHLFELKSSKLSYFRELSAQASQIVFWVDMTVFRLITTVWGKTSKSPISVSSVHKYKKSYSELFLSVLQLITTIWRKPSKISYLREFGAQVSQIVFSS